MTPTKPMLYRSTSAAKVGAIVMSVCGYMMSGFNFLVCISAVIALVVGVSNKAGVLAVAIIFWDTWDSDDIDRLWQVRKK